MKPILFNTDMVRAILEGRKTVTRRVVKPQPPKGCNVAMDRYEWNWAWWKDGEHHRLISPCYPGDILYVREAWQQNYDGSYSYRAKDMFEDEKGWRPSIHMPKEAARLFLRVTGVWVEKLQDIDEEGAAKEGMPDGGDTIAPVYCPRCKGVGLIGWIDPETMGFAEIDCPDCNTRRKRYANMWGSTIKPKDRDKYGWAANPWAWVIEFERISKEEALAAEVSG